MDGGVEDWDKGVGGGVLGGVGMGCGVDRRGVGIRMNGGVGGLGGEDGGSLHLGHCHVRLLNWLRLASPVHFQCTHLRQLLHRNAFLHVCASQTEHGQGPGFASMSPEMRREEGGGVAVTGSLRPPSEKVACFGGG